MKKVVLIGAIIAVIGCSHRIQNPSPVVDEKLPESQKEKSLSIKGGQGDTRLIYSPQDDEDYVVEVYHNKDVSIDGVNTSVFKNSFERSNNAIKLYNRSQYYVYRKNYDSAIYFVNQSLQQIETSEALALKGSILFIKGLTFDADVYWQKAIKLDSTIVIPKIH